MRLNILSKKGRQPDAGLEDMLAQTDTEISKADEYLKLNETIESLRKEPVLDNSVGVESFRGRSVGTESLVIAGIVAASVLLLGVIYKVYKHFSEKSATDKIMAIKDDVENLSSNTDVNTATTNLGTSETSSYLRKMMAFYISEVNIIADKNGVLIGFKSMDKFKEDVQLIDRKLSVLALEKKGAISDVVTKNELDTTPFKRTYDNVIKMLQDMHWKMPDDFMSQFTIKDPVLLNFGGEYNYVKGLDIALGELQNHLKKTNDKNVIEPGQLAKVMLSPSTRETILQCEAISKMMDSESGAIAAVAEKVEKSVKGLGTNLASSQSDEELKKLAMYIDIVKSTANIYKKQNLITRDAATYIGDVANIMKKESSSID